MDLMASAAKPYDVEYMLFIISISVMSIKSPLPLLYRVPAAVFAVVWADELTSRDSTDNGKMRNPLQGAIVLYQPCFTKLPLPPCCYSGIHA